MSVGDYGRRLDKLTEALSGSRRDRFRPVRVLQLIYCQHWHDEGSLEARAERAEHEIARQATIDQVCEWVADDAHRHGYDLPYSLVISFMADDPTRCMFDLPWRRESDGPRFGWPPRHAISWPLDGTRNEWW